MNNPFETLDRRLSNIEALLIDLKPAPTQNTDNTTDELFTTAEAAAFIKVSRQTLSAWKAENKIPFVRVGSLVRFRKSDLLGLNQKKKAA